MSTAHMRNPKIDTQVYYSVVHLEREIHMDSKLISIGIPDDVIAQYDAVARATGRARNTLMVEALRAAIATESWFVAAVERGLAAADRGEFVPDEEIETLWDELCR